MQFDAGTWWLAVLLLGGLTGALGYMIKHSFDKIEKKLDTAVPKEDFDTKIANHEAQIRKIQETYTPRTTHDKDVGELREKISRISENYLTKEDFYRENTKTDRKIESANQKIDRVIELQMQLLQQLSQKENSNMDMKEKLLAEMEQSDFAKNNGKIMRTLNVLAPSYHNLSSIQRILKDDGIGEGQYAACLDFLALEGYILLRTVKDHVRCEDLADHNWTELEAKLSGKGMRVLEKDVKDAMIEV